MTTTLAPAHRGMSPDITVYKQMVRDRVNALLKAEAAKPPAEASTN